MEIYCIHHRPPLANLRTHPCEQTLTYVIPGWGMQQKPKGSPLMEFDCIW